MVETTFALARPNVRVNGRNLEDADEDEAGEYLPIRIV
jgi:hypothetical protein